MRIPKPIILELGPDFYDPVQPATFPDARARFINAEKAQFLGLDELKTTADWQKRLHRFEPWPDNISTPLALRYHGHQFRHYNPDLGDGRGFLFAQFQGPDGKVYDLGTKGSGQTPYSRQGDGRLTLKGAVREALATEMLESLGVNTSKTFCFFETGEQLVRNDEPSPTRSAVLTRMSHGHIRIGTFQRLAYLQQQENLVRLLNYSVRNYFPEIPLIDMAPEDLAEAFLRRVSQNLASLSAQYMISGFVHGVLNSDNMNITGESFDYGPYRFMPAYDPTFTAAYFDQTGLYCFARQPSAIHWNVKQLAVSLQKAFPTLKGDEALNDFTTFFSQDVLNLFFKRLNLKTQDEASNDELISQFFLFLSKSQIGYEQAFFDLYGGINLERLRRSEAAALYQSEDFEDLQRTLAKFETRDPDKLKHPYFQNSKPCTLLIDEIEQIWSLIDQNDDWSMFHQKIDQIRAKRGLHPLF